MKLNYLKLQKTLEFLGYSPEQTEEFRKEFDSQLLQRIGDQTLGFLNQQWKDEIVSMFNDPGFTEQKLAEFFRKPELSGKFGHLFQNAYSKLLTQTMDNIMKSASEKQKEKIKEILSS